MNQETCCISGNKWSYSGNISLKYCFARMFNVSSVVFEWATFTIIIIIMVIIITFIYSEEKLQDSFILDPQWLVDAFKSLITAKKFCSRKSMTLKEWRQFDNTAILTNNLVGMFLIFEDCLFILLFTIIILKHDINLNMILCRVIHIWSSYLSYQGGQSTIRLSG